MKRFLALFLAAAVVLSFGATAFAAYSPTSGDNVDEGWGTYTVKAPAKNNELRLVIYDENDEVIAELYDDDVKEIAVDDADQLSPEDREAFLAAYEEAKAVEGKVVKYFYWLSISDKYADALAKAGWIKYFFKCAGENVQMTVNGKEVEVFHIEGVDYYAKLFELGAIAIYCD